MSKHTPGPWKQHLVDETLIVASDRTTVASTSIDYDKAETAEANARLIAAAPELLEALKIARDYIGANLGTYAQAGADFDKVSAAIAKAEGRT